MSVPLATLRPLLMVTVTPVAMVTSMLADTVTALSVAFDEYDDASWSAHAPVTAVISSASVSIVFLICIIILMF